MPNIIIDEYTNRTDLTGNQKWRLRHPGANAEASRKWRKANPEKWASAKRVWRIKNPDAYEAIQKRSEKKALLKKIDNFKGTVTRLVTVNSITGMAKRKEILHLHSRGKSLADICIWMRIPMSVVSRVIEQSNPL